MGQSIGRVFEYGSMVMIVVGVLVGDAVFVGFGVLVGVGECVGIDVAVGVIIAVIVIIGVAVDLDDMDIIEQPDNKPTVIAKIQ